MSQQDNRNTPILTVIVTTFNRAHFLREALESVRRQTLQDMECIITDRGSTDNTPEVVQPFLSDSRFRYFRHDPPRSMVFNGRYAFFALARGKYTVCLPDDDYYTDDTYLEEAVRILERNPGTVFVHANLSYKYEQTGEVRPVERTLPELMPGRDVFLAWGTKQFDYIYYSTVVHRKTLMLDLDEPFEMRFHHGDTLAWLLMSLRGPVGFINRNASVWRFHGSNDISSRDINRWLDDVEYVNVAYRYAVKSGLFSEAELAAWYSRMRKNYALEVLRLAEPQQRWRELLRTFLALGVMFDAQREPEVREFMWKAFRKRLKRQLNRKR